MQNNAIVIISYIAISFIFGYLFNSDANYSFHNHLPEGWRFLPASLGPFLAYMIFHRFLKGRTLNVMSNPPVYGFLILFLPILFFSVFGMSNSYGIEKHLFGLLISSTCCLYAFFEEAGWRGLLQNALIGFPDHIRYFLVGLVWWPWHFRFQTRFDFLIFPLFIFAASYGLGKIADTYKSFMITAGLHMLLVVTTSNGGDVIGKSLASVCSIICWIVCFRNLNRLQENKESKIVIR